MRKIDWGARAVVGVFGLIVLMWGIAIGYGLGKEPKAQKWENLQRAQRLYEESK